ncbi:mitochondrial 54S ribosomal protein uL11m [Calcarisporiella thermophila]|uniref:mitochondrial 54S ribosomal protein uL11m n=1 Tax=Calcarisporiella thermophila TaxID=911321 RepID=UPI003742FB6D
MSKQAIQGSSALLRLLVPAGKATPSPPVGPALGQRGIKSMDFCKQFNDRTSSLAPGTPIPTVITVNPDRTFTFVTKTPPTMFLLKRAAGIEKGAGKPGKEIAGKVSLKHVYEIAKIKQQDEHMRHLSLDKICGSIIGTARTAGIQVVP